MISTRGLLVRLDVQHGKDREVENFLTSALPLVRAEAATVAWFALRFGKGDYGIFDVFPDDTGRQAHLNGAVAQALMARADSLLASPPRITRLDVLAEKLPASPAAEPITKGLLLTFQPKSGHTSTVEQFLSNAKTLVEQEPKTIAWFGIRLDDGQYGIFDVFPDQSGRFAHLTGHVPLELARHALALLGGLPDHELPNVLATKLGE